MLCFNCRAMVNTWNGRPQQTQNITGTELRCIHLLILEMEVWNRRTEHNCSLYLSTQKHFQKYLYDQKEANYLHLKVRVARKTTGRQMDACKPLFILLYSSSFRYPKCKSLIIKRVLNPF